MARVVGYDCKLMDLKGRLKCTKYSAKRVRVGGWRLASGDLVFQSISDGSLRPLKSNASALRALSRVKIEMTF